MEYKSVIDKGKTQIVTILTKRHSLTYRCDAISENATH